jgi:hypothetical protein
MVCGIHTRKSRCAVPGRDEYGRKPYQRRALALLAGCGSGGCTERVVRMHGFTAYQLAELVHIGFATTTIERVVGEWGGKPAEVKTLKITEAGDRALGGQQ